jgi:hypothetical protein
MTDPVARDIDGAPIGINWLAIIGDITARPVPVNSEDAS